jgi:AhpD family alkylhydroperoxidase
MLRDSGLTKAEREMIVVAVAGANDCLYCFVAHGAILRVYAKQPLVADQVGVNYRKADITPRQKAMLAFALKVARGAARSATTTTRRCARTASATRTSGTSATSRRSSACRTGWRTSSTCGPTTNSSRWGERPNPERRRYASWTIRPATSVDPHLPRTSSR